MKLSCITGSKIVGVALLSGLWALACSSDEGDNTAATGGATSVGGAATTGGKTGVTGGKTGTSTTSTAKTGGAAATGGVAATGGASSSTAPKTGGASSIGGSSTVGTTGVGGANIGGVTSVGGASVGGATSTGGSTSTNDGGPESDAGVVCDGCLKLFVPLSAASTATDFAVDFGASTPEDFTTSVVTARVYVEATGNAGGLRLYGINDISYASVYETWTNLTDLDGGWHELKLDFAAMAALGDGGTGFDKSKVRWLGLNVNAGDTFTGAVYDDVTVYVDWIKFSDGAHPDFFFDANAVQGFEINKYTSPVAGSLLNGVPLAN